MLKRKWIRSTLLILASAFVIYMVGVCISVRFFESTNPVRSAMGIMRILWTDTPYVQVQEIPKDQYLIKSENFQENYQQFVSEVMLSKGFIEINEEQMGTIRCFKNKNESVQVSVSGNKYYHRCSVE